MAVFLAILNTVVLGIIHFSPIKHQLIALNVYEER